MTVLLKWSERGREMSIDRKQLILEAATTCFSLFGYKATTMEQVAKMANVGKGTIYTFYAHKEQLFKEIVLQMIREMKDEAEQVIQVELSFIENLHLVLYRILTFRKEHQLSIKLFQEEKQMGTSAVQEMINEIETAIVVYITEKIQIAIEKREIRSCNPEMTAFLLLKMYVALIFDWERTHPPIEKEKIGELIDLYLFEGLLNQS